MLKIPEVYQNFRKTSEIDSKKIEDFYVNYCKKTGSDILKILARTIQLSTKDNPSHQFLAGHVGVGKSATLLYLKSILERKNFYVVIVDAEEIISQEKMDLTDFLLGITGVVSQDLKQAGIHFRSDEVSEFFSDLKDFLNSEVDLKLELSVGIAKIMTSLQDDDDDSRKKSLKSTLNSKPRSFIDFLNKNFFEEATTKLLRRGKKGLVVLVDNLDKVILADSNDDQSRQNIFMDQAAQLLKIKCHCVFTMPLAIMLNTKNLGHVWHRLNKGRPPLLLTVYPIKDTPASNNDVQLLEEVVLARAFPDDKPSERKNKISFFFKEPSSLTELCITSGGHLGQLMTIIRYCFEAEEVQLPFPKTYIDERVAQYCRDFKVFHTNDDDMKAANDLLQDPGFSKMAQNLELFDKKIIFHYRASMSDWWELNPILQKIV